MGFHTWKLSVAFWGGGQILSKNTKQLDSEVKRKKNFLHGQSGPQTSGVFLPRDVSTHQQPQDPGYRDTLCIPHTVPKLPSNSVC